MNDKNFCKWCGRENEMVGNECSWCYTLRLLIKKQPEITAKMLKELKMDKKELKALDVRIGFFKGLQIIGALSRMFEEMAADGRITVKELSEKTLEFGLNVCKILNIDVEKDILNE